MPKFLGVLNKFRSRSPSPARGASSSSWDTAKEALILALKTAETALDGLPIPGAKPAVVGVIAIIERIDVSTVNEIIVPS